VDSKLWLISTNGAVFDHPDVDTARLIARVRGERPTILCNYESATTRRLRAEGKKVTAGGHGWITRFPEDELKGPAGGLRLRLETDGRPGRAAAGKAAESGGDGERPSRGRRKVPKARSRP
jgi:hypothetical protein